MSRTACYDLTEMVEKVTRDIGHLLKKDQFGWFLKGSSTALLRKDQSYRFLYHQEIKRWEHTGDRLNSVLIENDEAGYAKLFDIHHSGYVLDRNMRPIFEYVPNVNKHLLTKEPTLLKSAVQFVEAMVSETIVRKSKDTRISLDLRDFHSCFDLDVFFQETELKENITPGRMRKEIEHIVEKQFENHDLSLLPIYHFICAGDDRAIYETARTGLMFFVVEKQKDTVVDKFNQWVEYGISDKVMSYAEALMKEKDSEVSIRLF